MPNDSLSVNLQLSPHIELSSEYVEDPGSLIARNGDGMVYKCKLKVTLSYNSPPGRMTTGAFSNVQIDLNVPKGVFLEKKMFKYEALNFSGSSTPQTE